MQTVSDCVVGINATYAADDDNASFLGERTHCECSSVRLDMLCMRFIALTSLIPDACYGHSFESWRFTDRNLTFGIARKLCYTVGNMLETLTALQLILKRYEGGREAGLKWSNFL